MSKIVSQKKKLLFWILSPFAFIFLVLVFHHPLLTIGTKWWMNYHVPVDGGWQCQYARLSVVDRSLCFKDVIVRSRLSGNKMTCSEVKIPLFDRAKETVFRQPSLTLSPACADGKFDFYSLINRIATKVSADEGEVILLPNGSQPIRFFFSYFPKKESQTLGMLFLSHLHPSPKSADMIIGFHRKDEGIMVEGTVDTKDITWISHVIKCLDHNASSDWMIKSGLAKGKLCIDFQEYGKKVHVNSAVELQNMRCMDQLHGLELLAEELCCDFSYPRSDSEKGGHWWNHFLADALVKGGGIIFRDEDQLRDFALRNLEGTFQIHSLDKAEIQLEGQLERRGGISPIHLNANPSLTADNTLDIDLKLFVEPDFKHSADLSLSIAAEEDESYLIKGKFSKIDASQITVMQKLLGMGDLSLDDIQIRDGTLSCLLSIKIQKKIIQQFSIDDLFAENLQLYWDSKDILGFCSKLAGQGTIDLQNPLSLHTMMMQMEEGDFIFGRKDQQPISLGNVSMHFSERDRMVEPSWVRGTVEGIEGQIDIHGVYPNLDVALQVQSDPQKVLTLLDFDCSLSEDRELIRLKSNVFAKEGHWEADGRICLSASDQEEEEVIFKCKILDGILDYAKKPLMPLILQNIDELTFSAKKFKADILSIVEPLVSNGWNAKGWVAFDGKYDRESLVVRFDPTALTVISPYLDIEFGDNLTPVSGTLTYLVAEKKLQGQVDILNGKCFEKYLGLKFHDVHSTFHFGSKELAFLSLETESEGIALGGEVRLHYNKDSSPTLFVKADSAIGTTGQLEALVHHFSEFSDLRLPFDGRITGSEGGFVLQTEFKPSGALTSWTTDLSLTHGSYQLNDELTIHDITFDAHWQSEKEGLRISNFTARCVSANGDDPYLLNGNEFFYDGKEKNAHFDLRVESAFYDLCRLVGVIDLDKCSVRIEQKKSHFFGAPLECPVLWFKDDFSLRALQLKMRLSLLELPSYARFINDFGGATVPKILLSQIDKWDLEGNFATMVTFQKGVWNLGAEGRGFRVGPYAFDSFLLALSKQGNEWIWNKVELDDFSICAKCIDEDIKWSVPNLHVKYADSELLFERGEFDNATGLLSLPLTSGGLDLNRLGFKEVIPYFGEHIDSTGTVECDFAYDAAPFRVQGRLHANSDKAKSDGPINFTYSNDQGIAVTNSKLYLHSEEDKVVSCEIPYLIYDPFGKLYKAKAIKLSSDAKNLIDMVKGFDRQVGMVEPYIPRPVDGLMSIGLDLIAKADGQLETKISLGKGEYFFGEKKVDLDGIVCGYNKQALDVHFMFPYADKFIQIDTKTLLNDSYETSIEAFDYETKKQLGALECAYSPKDGIVLHSISGDAFGLEFSLLPQARLSDEKRTVFLTKMSINARELSPALPSDVQELISELNFGDGYELQGEFYLMKKQPASSYFEGFLKGKDFEFLGYQFKTLFGNISIDKNRTFIRNLQLTDDSGNAQIREMKVTTSGKDITELSIPELTVHDLRPSLLKKNGIISRRLRPFQIKNLVINDIVGDLNDRTTITGKGTLNFENTFKRDYNLLDLPIEIISRLGLDLVLLVPIQGDLDFMLQDGRAKFSKLRNSYSEMKRSYFYLSNKSESYVGLDGQMHLNIKMKQYVLFKITELFMLSVRGTLENPTFSLK